MTALRASFAAIRSRFVGLVYADHNRSSAVRRAVGELLNELPIGGIGLNVGSGYTSLDPRIKNIDIRPAERVHCVADAMRLPFPDDSFDVIVTQETLEHVRDPFSAASEMSRVLRPGGSLYVQLPFVIGYHPGPTDFWRFTREGIIELVERAGLTVARVDVAVGAATGFYRVAVEFWAVLASSIWRRLYIPTKALASLLLYPIKLLDAVTSRSPQDDRIAGGYLVLATKPNPAP